MIYLFNSAFELTYQENVYRLVGLPQGVRVVMRYTEGVNAPGAETDAKWEYNECIVCYVDRFDNQYVYYPCRKGVIFSIRRDQGRVYYDILLGNHCHSRLPKDFTNEIQTSVGDSPRLTNDDPKCREDGIYCVQGPDVGELVSIDDDSWSKVVDQIYETNAFGNGVPALFLLDINRKGKKPKSNKGGLKLLANTTYELTVQYRFPPDRIQGSNHHIRVKMGSEINVELSVGSVADQVVRSFKLPPLEFSDSQIIIETIAPAAKPDEDEICVKATVPLNKSVWPSFLILIGVLFLISFIEEIWKVNWSFTDLNAWISTGFTVLKLGILLGVVFKFRGKLKVPGL